MAYRIADLVEQVKHKTSNASTLTKGRLSTIAEEEEEDSECQYFKMP